MDKCDVKAVFGVSKQQPGKYVVTVSHEDDDWYEVFGASSYIKTSSCLSLALGEEAYLAISPSGFGRLHFKDGDDCMVEAVYTKLRLPDLDAYVLSFEAGVAKPNPAIYEAVCATLGCSPSEVLFIGDSQRCDDLGPRAFGMSAHWLDRASGQTLWNALTRKA